MVFCKKDNKNKCNKVFKALVLDIIANNNLKKQNFNCFFITFEILFTNKAAFVSTELVNKAYAHLFITLINVTGLVTKADLFVYSITVMLCYTFIVFIRIMVNTNISKKFIISYKQF
jgi:hypothetical protein